MSQNIKIFTNFDRFDKDKNGRSIPVYRQETVYLTKQEVLKARENKEKLKINVH